MDKKAGVGYYVVFAVFAIALMGVGVAFTNGKNVIENKVSMAMVSHTEYRSNETGQIVARLVDFQGNPIAGTTCYATIKYPDKTAFVTNESMTASTVAGNFYKTFTTPAMEGIYEYEADCYYGVNKKAIATNSYHLSPSLNTISEVNSTMNALALAVGGNFTEVLNKMTALNSTMLSEFDTLNATVVSQVTGLDLSLSSKITSMNSTMTSSFANVLVELQNVNSSLWNKIDSMNVQFGNLNTTINNRFDSVDGNLTLLLDRQLQTNTTVSNTWDLLSVTIAGQITGMQLDLAQLLSTTNAINSTVNDIKANQENQVYVSVVSG